MEMMTRLEYEQLLRSLKGLYDRARKNGAIRKAKAIHRRILALECKNTQIEMFPEYGRKEGL